MLCGSLFSSWAAKSSCGEDIKLIELRREAGIRDRSRDAVGYPMMPVGKRLVVVNVDAVPFKLSVAARRGGANCAKPTEAVGAYR